MIKESSLSQADWPEVFDSLVDYFSKNKFESDLLMAKDIFFEKLGRRFEFREDFYESVSQSFLEWYIFNFRLPAQNKTPIITYLMTVEMSAAKRELLEKMLFQHWSLFEVKDFSDKHLILTDLLFSKERSIEIDSDSFLWKSWKIKKYQLVQARLFPSLSTKGFYFLTGYWIHPVTEAKILKDLCAAREPIWQSHESFMKSCFDCLLRTMSLQDQMKATQSQNWLYQELGKQYAKAS